MKTVGRDILVSCTWLETVFLIVPSVVAHLVTNGEYEIAKKRSCPAGFRLHNMVSESQLLSL